MEYRFDRYRNGRKMAEGLVLTKPKTADDAVAVASRLGEAGDVFVLREDLTRLAAAEAERDAARARWCEENKADVVWDWRGNQWRCENRDDMWMDQDRNAAIDYVRRGLAFWQSPTAEDQQEGRNV